MNKTILAALVLLALLAAGAAVLAANLGSIIKAAVVAEGPKILGAPVTLASVSISPLSGDGEIRELVIGNPPGFKSASAVRVARVEVSVDPRSLFSDEIVVRRVAVDGPELTWEIGPGGSNLTRLRQNAEAAAGPDAPKTGNAPSAKPAKSLLIRDFTVTGGKLGLAATILGGQGLTVALPEVHLTDLGGPHRSVAQVAAQALRAVEASAQGAASGAGSRALEQARGAVRSFLGGLLGK